jgi:hypothetical protein
MGRPSLPVVQGKVRVLKPTVAVYDIGAFLLYHPTHNGHRTRIGGRRVERARGICVKGRQGAAPSTDTEDAYTIEFFLGWMVTGLECHDCDSVAKADQLAGERLHMPFETADDGPVEITQLEDMH